jgi:hypothetical protein
VVEGDEFPHGRGRRADVIRNVVTVDVSEGRDGDDAVEEIAVDEGRVVEIFNFVSQGDDGTEPVPVNAAISVRPERRRTSSSSATTARGRANGKRGGRRMNP